MGVSESFGIARRVAYATSWHPVCSGIWQLRTLACTCIADAYSLEPWEEIIDDHFSHATVRHRHTFLQLEIHVYYSLSLGQAETSPALLLLKALLASLFLRLQLEDILLALDSTASGSISPHRVPPTIPVQRVAAWAAAVAARLRQRSPLACKVTDAIASTEK